MRARRTPWWSFVLAAALGVLAGMGLAKYGEISGLPLVGAPWIVPVVLEPAVMSACASPL